MSVRPQTISARRSIRCVCRLLCTIFAAGLVATAASGGTRVVGIGSFDNSPYQFLDKNGEPSGLDVELFMAAASAAGLTAETRTVNERVMELEGHEVRLGVSYTELAVGETASLPFAKASHTLFANDRSLVRGIEDLRSKQIAVANGNSALIQYLKQHGYGNQLTFADSVEHAFAMMAEDKVEVSILDSGAAKLSLDTIKQGAGRIREVEKGIAPYERTFATAASATHLRDQLEEGVRTLVRTGQYERMLVSHLGSAATAGEVKFGSATSMGGKLPILIAAMLGAFGLLLALRMSEFKGRAAVKMRELEERLAAETEAQQDLRISLARQQFVINRMSTTNLVDVIKDASRK